MSEQQHSSEHHHHHHHRMDSASRFKYRSLNAIKRRKLIAKWGLRILMVIAAVMVIYATVLYII